MKKTFMAAVFAAICLGTAGANHAEAKQLNYALGAPPNTPAHTAINIFAEAVKEESKGDLTVRVYALSLLNFAEMSVGLRDGIADIGLVLTPYHPAEYPPINLVGESSMLLRLIEGTGDGKEGLAFGAAMSEFIFFNCPDCLDKYKKQNQVYIGHAAGTPYGLMCTTPIKTVADLKGKRVRVGASNFARWAQSMGAAPVTLSANEMLEALSQGIVDCIALSSPEILNYGLGDTITDLTMAVPGGVFPFSFQVNANTWKGLTTERRAVMLRAMAKGAAATSYTYLEAANDGLGFVTKKGAKFHEASPELLKASQEFIEEDVNTLIAQYEKQYKLGNAGDMIATFRPILEKWVGLVQDVESLDDLTDLYWKHLMSKIDPATYGM
jgi:TRAP-type C4-dicarboxylate transport system substrate-binding protein